MILGTLQSFASTTYSQSTRLTLNLKNATVEQVLSTIEKESQFYFTYSVKEINANKKVSVHAENQLVEEVLQQIFTNSGVKYVIKDRHITLYRAEGNEKNSLPNVQQKKVTIKGVVKDNTGLPVTGAAVVAKGTTNGTVTDIDGNYSLSDVPENLSLVFSFIGMKTEEVKVNGKNLINMVLHEDAIGLNEVVAIGYGYQKKRDLTGSVSSVTSKDMMMGGTVSNAAQALQGKTAGVQVSQTSKAPGGSISVRVRGSNSISSTNEPLYVVDGFPSSEGLNINPNDIESMQILKDASATAIYGARGANGVVLITTKRGKSGENKISYNGYLGAQQLINPFDLLNGKDYMNLANDLFKEVQGQEHTENGAYTPSQLQSDVNTDWIDVCSRIGLVQDHNIQFQGGSDKTKVLTSLGYYNQDGILKNTNFTRISGRVNVDQTINDYIKAGATLYAHRETSNFQLYSGNIVNSNVLLGILSYDPTVRDYNDDGTYGRVPGGRGDNPLANLMERQNDSKNDKFNGSAYVEIHPLEGLTAKATAGVEILHNFEGSYLPASTYQGGIDNGVASTYDYTGTRQVFEGVINYMKTFNKVHDFSAMLGYTYEKFEGEFRRIEAKNFSTDVFTYNNLGAAALKSSIGSNKTENLLISFFGRVNYTFNDKYLATVTVRRDGSSRFGVNNRWGTFPSGSLAWRMSEEDFIKNLNIFSNLKMRLGFGVTGNERIGDYASLALMNNTHLSMDGSGNLAGTHMNQSSPQNENLKWETTEQYNIGLDMGFFDNRLAVSVDGYFKKTKDLLLNVNMPMYTGFVSGQSNVGSIQNRGFELDLTSHNLTGDFIWDTKFNFAINRNKVLDLGGSAEILIKSSKPNGTVTEQEYAVVREGEPLGSLYGYQYLGVIQAGEKYALQPDAKPGDPKFADRNGDGTLDANDRGIIGNANPDFIFGLTNNFAYKGFDLSIFFQGSVGNDLLNMTRMNMELSRSTDALNRWTPTNTNTDLPRNGFYNISKGKGGYVNDHFIEDASFLRLKNLTLGYTIPFKKVVNSCRVYASIENLFTITGYSGWDPEVDTKAYDAAKNKGSNQTANVGAGLDFNAYPSMRTYTIGLNVSF
ncbi:MAG: TonB-dependent receptor [Tannerellaceae bacterium]